MYKRQSLHRTNITTERRWNIADELALLHDRLNKAAALRPLLAERITALLPALDALGATLADRPACGIHRDCYPDQILVADAGAHLTWLDLDLYCHGDPALDVGNFLAHMTEHALRHYGDAAALAAQENALQQHYQQETGTAPEAIAAWTTLALARHIYLSTQFPERHHTTAPLLALCEQRLQKT
ncbi:phosphotransferase [Cardiobacterium hominis]|uniref:phosphotransferase n=1 Tax=Cardiobacterium hominis TaxID=2718 RepID=UPI00248F63E5|nr:phosphotransferase [Cardiobacterium hominis]